MKKLLLILGSLVVLVMIGVGIFIATFNADRYRPQLVQGLQQALGRPVTLDKLKLGWRNGIALELHGFSIPEAGSAEPLVKVQTISALIRLQPLLKKDIQVASIGFTEPAVHVMRDAQGRVNLMGLAPTAAPVAAAQQPPAVAEGPVALRVDSLQVEAGSLHWTDAGTRPQSEIWLRQIDARITDIAPGRPITVDVSAALNASTKNARIGGRVTLPNPPDQQGAVEQLVVSLERAPIESFAPAAAPNVPHAKGLVTVKLTGELSSLDPARLQRAADVSGTIRLDDVVLVNVNVLREVFSRLSILPGLVQRLQERLPENYQAKLQARDTPLSPTEIPLQLSDGVLRCEQLDIATDTFHLNGSVSVSADQIVQGQGLLQVDPMLSEAIIRGINELQALANAEGALEIPLTLQGRLPHVAVLPDVNYVASRVVTRKAADFIGSLLAPKEDEAPDAAAPQTPADGSAPDGPASPSTAEEPSDGDILRQLLQRALERPRPADTPAQ